MIRKRILLAGEIGLNAERMVRNWLEDQHYHVIYWHEGKRSNLPYDIIAETAGEKWAIDVKAGKKPSVNISNILKIVEARKLNTDKQLIGVNKVGLAMVVEGQSWPFIFEYSKMSHAGHKAALTLKRKKAGIKAGETRRRNINVNTK